MVALATAEALSQLGVLGGGFVPPGFFPAVGVKSETLWNRADRHPRLNSALPPLQNRPRRNDKQAARRKRQQEQLRELWPDLTLTTDVIASRIGVGVKTMYTWREELGLPYRIPRKPAP
ncbi:hypothetical protein ACIQVO_36780 [Streptomyces sp. NPDC101062]|uniref:hypothetical protein n=1 Tax=unclassified Streptomyces TaxID=2593676 RepID=UPI0037FB192C